VPANVSLSAVGSSEGRGRTPARAGARSAAHHAGLGLSLELLGVRRPAMPQHGIPNPTAFAAFAPSTFPSEILKSAAFSEATLCFFASNPNSSRGTCSPRPRPFRSHRRPRCRNRSGTSWPPCVGSASDTFPPSTAIARPLTSAGQDEIPVGAMILDQFLVDRVGGRDPARGETGLGQRLHDVAVLLVRKMRVLRPWVHLTAASGVRRKVATRTGRTPRHGG
jgi:hypothetical protein